MKDVARSGAVCYNIATFISAAGDRAYEQGVAAPMHVTVAAIQMFAVPFAVPRNLARARQLVEEAVDQGAQIVLLPELFNTGYSYNTQLFDYAEPLDGVTVAWLRDGATRRGCYLAGGILERSGSSAYSTLVMASPDGSIVAYRKRHPFFWERSVFQAGSGAPCVAHTPLGRIGLLVGADIAADECVAAYATQVDLLLVSSTAAHLPASMVKMPSGRTLRMDRFHPAFVGRSDQMRYDYYGGVGRRAANLGAPIVHAVQCGTFHSPLPIERMGLLRTLLRYPRQLELRLSHGTASVSTPFLGHSAVFGSSGATLAVQPEDEGVIVASIALPARSVHYGLPPVGFTPNLYASSFIGGSEPESTWTSLHQADDRHSRPSQKGALVPVAQFPLSCVSRGVSYARPNWSQPGDYSRRG